jgi:penicillin-binding protein 1C
LGEFKPYRFLARDVEWTAAPKRVFTPTTAYLVADMLSDDSARAATFGLHSQLDFDFPVACKTGTSSDYRDNWTVGFTPEYTVGVWVGRPDGAGMMGVSGVSGAAPVFHAMLEYLHTHYGTSWYERPAGIAAYRVDPLTGRCAPAQGPRAVWAQCASDPGPPTAGDYDAEGRVRVPPEYREWINGAMNPYGGELVVREESEPLRVAEPLDGTVFFLDPDLPPENQSVCLKAVGAAEGALEWECESAPVIARGGRVRLELREGTHEVRVRVRGSNQSASTRLEVRAL